MDRQSKSRSPQTPMKTSEAANEAALGVLALWSSMTGLDLVGDNRAGFLDHPAVLALAEFPVAALVVAARRAGRPGRLSLNAWLAEVRSGSDSPVESSPTATSADAAAPAPPRPRRSTPRRSPVRSVDKLVPQRPVDWELAKKIGPVQRYDDSF